MARIRTIKPDFWSDDVITDCSLSARLLFIGTWNFADDKGNLDRSAKQIKARVFPMDNIDCEPLIVELLSKGLLVEYSVNGKPYLHINGFDKHQKIDRPSNPVCPEYAPELASAKHSTSPRIPLDTEGKGKERKGGDVAKATPTPTGLDLLKDIDQQIAKDWLAIRKAKNMPLTKTALDGIKREAEKAKLTLEQTIKMCCENNWAGFKASWDEVKSLATNEEHWYQRAVKEGKML